MGKPAAVTPVEQPYRDDEEIDAVSMHTTRSDYEYDDVPELPSYAESEAALTNEEPTTDDRVGPPTDEYTVIPSSASGLQQQSHGKQVTLKETTIRMDERLNDPDELQRYILGYLRMVPPKPAVRIYGWHSQTTYRNNKRETERVTDFDIVLRLDKYLQQPAVRQGQAAQEFWQPRVALNSDRVHRGGWRKTRARGYKQDIEVGSEPAPDLKDWCNDFCLSNFTLKVFRVTRDLSGLNQDYLSTQIEGLIRGTGYRGHTTVSFPVEDRHVDIYNPHWIQTWRVSWVRFIFYISMLWIITWPLLFFFTRRWGVYVVDWRFSYDSEVLPGTGEGRMARRVKKYASISESAWFDKHTRLLSALVMDGWQGDATNLPLDTQSRTRRDENGRVQTGSRNVDAAVSAVQGGLNVWNAMSGRGAARGSSGWGGDES